jgi:hypothetical protein
MERRRKKQKRKKKKKRKKTKKGAARATMAGRPGAAGYLQGPATEAGMRTGTCRAPIHHG